jgi:hypothetical protein
VLNKIKFLSTIKYFVILFFKLCLIKDVDNKRMASEIPTHMLNQQKFIISGLKFSLRALVICGLFNITKFVTRKEYIILLIF